MYRAPRLVLASSSPRRAELLRVTGVVFTVQAADIDESVLTGEGAEDYVRRLAAGKATAVAASIAGAAPVDGFGGAGDPGWLVVGADTTVVVDDEILNKPAGAADARRMLGLLSGRSHRVLTGVAVAGALPAPAAAGPVPFEPVTAVVVTGVTFRALAPHRIDWYVGTGEPFGKAGAYAVQGIAGLFVDRIDGNAQNVIGLPLAALDDLLTGLRHPLLGFSAFTTPD